MRIRTLALTLSAAAGGIALTRALNTRVPHGITPVTGFDVRRYMGTWHEIARLDHRFERGMTNVKAIYSLNDDGSVRVVNRGQRNGVWREVQGRAVFRGDPGTASLEVTFFWPLAGGYHVFALDPEYRWAMISGPNRGYLWILSRKPQMDEETYQQLVGTARDKGFPVEQLVRTRDEGE